MTHTMRVYVDKSKVMADMWQLIAGMKYDSGENIGYTLCAANSEDDIQQTLLYDVLTAAHARAIISSAGSDEFAFPSTVIAACFNNGNPYAEVQFVSKDDAMLFKLTYGGET